MSEVGGSQVGVTHQIAVHLGGAVAASLLYGITEKAFQMGQRRLIWNALVPDNKNIIQRC